MKKIISICCLLVFILSACNNDKSAGNNTVAGVADSVKAKPKKLDVKGLVGYSLDDVIRMAARYKEIISTKPENVIRQVNMGTEALNQLLYVIESFKLIAAADLKTGAITTVIEVSVEGILFYFDINTFFNAHQSGMQEKGPVCPPLESCNLPLEASADPELFTTEKVNQMANNYYNMVQRNPDSAILQIVMPPQLLQTVIFCSERLKLIPAAYTERDSTTVLLQINRGGAYYYYDIRDMFNEHQKGMRNQSPLCPPPSTCDLPLVPKKTNMAADSSKMKK